MKDKLRPRGTVAAMVVAAIYVVLVLGAPILVRYGPQPEIGSAVAHTAAPAKH
ncbi:MAG: hypothetical protein U1F54_16605 [Burkholderiales bacterium]